MKPRSDLKTPPTPVTRDLCLDLLCSLSPTPARIIDLCKDLRITRGSLLRQIKAASQRFGVTILCERERVFVSVYSWSLVYQLALDYWAETHEAAA